MTAIRLMARVAQNQIEAARTATRIARDMPGCLHAEDFADIEATGDFLHVELWDKPGAWDAAWAKRAEMLAPALQRVEFYKHAHFTPTGPTWEASDPDVRAQSIRWPIADTIRILIFVAVDPDEPNGPRIQDSVETRQEPGCGEFIFYRSLDFAENVALIETWSSPEIYDIHWKRRIAQDAQPYPEPPERRYGETSFEWYQHTDYKLIDGLWQPTSADRRMTTVLW